MLIGKILLTIWLGLSFIIALSKSGQPKTGTWNCKDTIIGFIIVFGLLILGGFYS